MALTSLATIEAAQAANRVLSDWFATSGFAGTGTGPFGASSWYNNTSTRPPIGADAPTTPGTTYVNQKVGGITFPDTSPTLKYLHDLTLQVPGNGSNLGTFWLVDRLVGVNVALNSTGDKTVNSVALPRYTSGDGVQCFIEMSAASSTTAAVCSLSSYTNQDGTSGRAGATVTLPSVAWPKAGVMWMPLQAGDTGVKSVETLNVATASGGSAACNVLLVKMLGTIPMGSVAGTDRQWNSTFIHPVQVFDGATLFWVWRHKSANSDPAYGLVSVLLG